MNDPQPTVAPPETPARASSYRPSQPVQPEGTQSPTTILLFGILGFLFGPLGGIGWWYGKKYLEACSDENLRPDQNAVVGMYLGMISFLIFCVFAGMALVMFLLWFVFFAIFFGLYLVIMLLAIFASL